MNSNIDDLLACIELMAASMEFKSLPQEKAKQLIEHVLFDQKYYGVEGKQAWACYASGIITKREVRNLLMAHAATKIAHENQRNEPQLSSYISPELCHRFECALFGKKIIVRKYDVLDPWEKLKA